MATDIDGAISRIFLSASLESERVNIIQHMSADGSKLHSQQQIAINEVWVDSRIRDEMLAIKNRIKMYPTPGYRLASNFSSEYGVQHAIHPA